jgi:hypothetical protein
VPDCPDCVVLRAELATVQAALDLEVSMRCKGGTNAPVDKEWGNIALPPPPSASDSRMPSHRRVGMGRSTDQKPL